MELCQAMMKDNTTVRYDQKYKQNEANMSILLIAPPNNISSLSARQKKFHSQSGTNLHLV